MRPPWLQSLVAVGISLSVSVRAHAQPLFGFAESIDCMVANADTVVVGTIVEFGGGERADERGGRPATIAVEETLKGEHRERLRVRLAHPVRALANWKDRSCRLLVARGVPPTETRVLDLASQQLEVLTADFTVLRKPEDVTRSAKEAIRRMPGVKQIDTFAFGVPAELIAGTKWAEYHATSLSVPVDARLEKRAHELVRSDSYSQRAEGARALRYFKSDDNVARVKALLNDSGWAYLQRAEENKGSEVRAYGVREKAYETLTYWGVRVEKPTTREALWKPDSVRLADLSNRKVTEADLRELGRFKNLQDVFLWNTDVTDERLKELAGLTNLRNLYLGGTKVTGAGLKHLDGLTNLRYLDLKGTRVADEGLRMLAGFKSLRKVDLGDTEVADTAVAELRKLRPDLTIER